MDDSSRNGAELHSDLPRGALYMVCGGFMFAAMGAAVKLLSASFGNPMVVFARSALGLVLLLPWLARVGPAGIRTRALREHLVRGVAGLLSMYCFFFVLARMRLADAVLLNYSAPLFVPFIERAWLGEEFSPRLWRGIAIGFVGLLLILKPGLTLFQPAALVGVLAALLAGTAQVGVRRLTQTEPVTRIVFYFALASTLLSAAPAALTWTPLPPIGSIAGTLAALGVSATLGQLAMTRAYSYAPAAQVGPFIYSAVVFAGLFDWALFAKLPDLLSVLGAFLICAAGVLTLRVARTREVAPPEL